MLDRYYGRHQRSVTGAAFQIEGERYFQGCDVADLVVQANEYKQ